MGGRIRVLPAAITFEVREGESVFQAAQRHNIRWPTVCNGQCECGVCYMLVEEGSENLSSKSREESRRLALGIKAKDPRARLACRTHVTGDATVVRIGVRRAHDGVE